MARGISISRALAAGKQQCATTETAIAAAADLAANHRLGIWDSLMVAVVEEGGCRLLLSEDLQDGSSSRGVTVVNPCPFGPKRHPLLAGILGEARPPEP
jgi:predicted nucleic acid-binding protein